MAFGPRSGTCDRRDAGDLADYLVGADGHRSRVRSTLGIAMEGPDDLGQYFSILFRADLSEVLGERRYGLYTLAGDGPPRVLVPSGVDDRFVFGDAAAARHRRGGGRGDVPAGVGAWRWSARLPGRPDLDVEILATSAFAFSAQVASAGATDGPSSSATPPTG